jgi:hypothetical protein
MNAAFEKYGGCAQFADEAAKAGRTLAAVVGDYVEAEKAWRKHPIEGIEYLCGRTGIYV